MIKKFLIFIVTFVMVFTYQAKSWATVNQADKLVETMTIEKNTFLQTDASPFVLAANSEDLNAKNTNSSLWVASIFIPGLGQILMGDAIRGLSFWFYAILVTVTVAIIAISQGAFIDFGTGRTAGFIAFRNILYLIVYVWNIIDAVNMASEKNVSFSLTDFYNKSKQAETNLPEMQKKLRFLEKIRLSQNGISIEAISF